MAPFLSIIHSFKDLKFNIFHGVRLSEDIYTLSELKNYNVFISKYAGEKNNFIKIYNGRITSNFEIIKKHINLDDLFFICGNSFMINDIYDFLKKNEINANNIYSELFF